MSAISKDALIQACADAYKTASGESGVKAGELASKIALLAGGGASNVYFGKYTPTEDITNLEVVHNLGTTDILLAAVFAESFEGVELTANAASASVFLKTDYPQYLSTANGNAEKNFFALGCYYYSNGYSRPGSTNTDSFAPVISDENKVTFKPAGGTNFLYRAGVTYTAIVIAEVASV